MDVFVLVAWAPLHERVVQAVGRADAGRADYMAAARHELTEGARRPEHGFDVCPTCDPCTCKAK